MISWLAVSCMHAASPVRSSSPRDPAQWRNAGHAYRPIGASGEPYSELGARAKGEAGALRSATPPRRDPVRRSSSLRSYDTSRGISAVAPIALLARQCAEATIRD
jgi:hypothetical protein